MIEKDYSVPRIIWSAYTELLNLWTFELKIYFEKVMTNDFFVNRLFNILINYISICLQFEFVAHFEFERE